jgi:hypothetical protein
VEKSSQQLAFPEISKIAQSKEIAQSGHPGSEHHLY